MSPKQVTFGELTIYEHGLELGDNPACSSGAPLTIGWECQETTTRNLELYEYMRTGRRSRKQLPIPIQSRAQLLLQSGYSINEIADATMAVELVKKQRADSMKGTPFSRAGALLEKTGQIPKDLLMGVANLVNPKRNSVQARSA